MKFGSKSGKIYRKYTNNEENREKIAKKSKKIEKKIRKMSRNQGEINQIKIESAEKHRKIVLQNEGKFRINKEKIG